MDKDQLILNIEKAAEAIGKRPTPACVAAGVGKDFLSDIRRGRLPSVSKVADLAAYLGVTTSDLVGDARQDQPSPLSEAWDDLNEEGRERLLETADDMVRSGKYKKHPASELDQNAG